MATISHACFAEGCFWCVEETFRSLRGVISTEAGYTGGTTENPTYREVCTGNTGHAEAVHLTFNPEIISYQKLVHIFFTTHDPTTLNRQGPDHGTQYRSAIFTYNDEQKQIAEEIKEQYQKEEFYAGRIVTEITPVSRFYRAEEYHQQYIRKRNEQRG